MKTCLSCLQIDTMKKYILLAVMILPMLALPSCNSDDDDDGLVISDLVGTYVGAMNVQNPDFTNAQYTVTVTQLTATAVKITPSTGVATEWTATLTNILGVYTCVGCVTSNQITFTSIGNGVELSYNYGNNNEQFAGTKQ